MLTKQKTRLSFRSGGTPFIWRLSTHIGLVGLIAIIVLLDGSRLSIPQVWPLSSKHAAMPDPPPPLNSSHRPFLAAMSVRAGMLQARQTVTPTEPTATPMHLAALPERTMAGISTDLSQEAPADARLRVSNLQYPTFIARAAVPHTTIPDRPREEIITYTVQSGDIVTGIAEKFKISPETIMWANGDLEYHPDSLAIGQVLTILPVSGVYHKVLSGETLSSIATKYKVEVSAIVDHPLNGLEPGQGLVAGQMLIVPGGEKPYVPRSVTRYTGTVPESASRGTGSFGWPASGRLTQNYWSLHRAIDIAAPAGTPVVAADSGFVVHAGWNKSGYGNLIIIDHGNEFVTYYAHLSAFYCKVGDSVAKGQKIGGIGSTGRSTGNHLHFEIRQNDVQRNPFGFLP